MEERIIKTKVVDRIKVSEAYKKENSLRSKNEKLLEKANEALEGFSDLLKDIEECWNNNLLTFDFNGSKATLYPKLGIVLTGEKKLDYFTTILGDGILRAETYGSNSIRDGLEKFILEMIKENFGMFGIDKKDLLSIKEVKKIYGGYGDINGDTNNGKIVLCKGNKKCDIVMYDVDLQKIISDKENEYEERYYYHIDD